ncbi:MAG: 50S ribosomal protein L30 [candidate division Zixibacteria bacterium RBG_16_50_21]|nr:MAG: 50S ribosomal protein L30 [candidate division Zixibacteria bacterium RBG_16_50_21]
MAKRIQITQIKSAIGYTQNQKITVRTLGLRRLHHSIIHTDTPQIRGMIEKVKHLVQVEEVKKGK